MEHKIVFEPTHPQIQPRLTGEYVVQIISAVQFHLRRNDFENAFAVLIYGRNRVFNFAYGRKERVIKWKLISISKDLLEFAKSECPSECVDERKRNALSVLEAARLVALTINY